MNGSKTHSKAVGYILWIFGFMGAHRFYFGRPVTGTIWLLTLGLVGVGWLIDLFLIPGMARGAAGSYKTGSVDFNLCWILLTFLGVFGVHRFYMGKILSGILYLCTGGLFIVGIVYDYWTLNEQISAANTKN